VNDIDRIAERLDDEARAAGVPEDALDEAVHEVFSTAAQARTGGLLLPASPIRDLFSGRWWRPGQTRSRSSTRIQRWSSGLMREWDGRAPSPHGRLLAAAAPTYRSLNGRMHLSVGRNPARTVDRSGSMPDSTPRPRLVKAFGIICAYGGTVFLLPPTEH
jgi:hypothetical protein